MYEALSLRDVGALDIIFSMDTRDPGGSRDIEGEDSSITDRSAVSLISLRSCFSVILMLIPLRFLKSMDLAWLAVETNGVDFVRRADDIV